MKTNTFFTRRWLVGTLVLAMPLLLRGEGELVVPGDPDASVPALPLPIDEPQAESSRLLEASYTTDVNARALHLKIPAPRGLILDRNGVVLAHNKVAYYAAINFPTFPDENEEHILRYARHRIDRTNRLLGKEWEVSDAAILRHYRNRRWLPLTFGDILSDDEASHLADSAVIDAGDKPDILLQPVYLRVYPHGKSAAHIIGYTGRVGWFPTGPAENGEPLWEKSEGRSGIELSYDEHLQGTDGTLSTLFAADGSELTKEIEERPVPGNSVVLSIDIEWQKRAETILANHMERGAMVVLDTNTGEILVMASVPSFDPNDWVPNITSDVFRALNEAPEKPLLNRAYQSSYPPASTFKVPIAMAALKTGTITADTRISGPPSLQVGNRSFRNWNQNHEGMIDLVTAMARSTNTWFYQVAMRVGADPIVDMSRTLGFGSRTGIPLQGENAGFMPDNDWSMKRWGHRILAGGLCNIAIGQGDVTSTPLQLARAMAAIGNGSHVPRIELVRQVQDVNNHILEQASLSPGTSLGLDISDVLKVQDSMVQVVNGSNGTARSARLDSVTLAGKTGTGQWILPRNQRVAWFSGFVPAEKPQYAFAILREGRPGETIGGGSSAAPIAAEFFESIFDERVAEEEERLAAEKQQALDRMIEAAQADARERERLEEEALRSRPADADLPRQEIVDEVLEGIIIERARPIDEETMIPQPPPPVPNEYRPPPPPDAGGPQPLPPQGPVPRPGLPGPGSAQGLDEDQRRALERVIRGD